MKNQMCSYHADVPTKTHRGHGSPMEKATLTTTLSELNRLYGVYYEATKNTDAAAEATLAWIAYETYARLYKLERGLQITLEPRRRT